VSNLQPSLYQTHILIYRRVVQVHRVLERIGHSNVVGVDKESPGSNSILIGANATPVCVNACSPSYAHIIARLTPNPLLASIRWTTQVITYTLPLCSLIVAAKIPAPDSQARKSS